MLNLIYHREVFDGSGRRVSSMEVKGSFKSLGEFYQKLAEWNRQGRTMRDHPHPESAVSYVYTPM